MRRGCALPLLLLLLAACAAGRVVPARRAPGPAPAAAHAVATRTLTFTDWTRVTDPTPGHPGDETRGRTLVTTVWYPATGGPYPVVLFSHGLLGTPADYRTLAERWAGAGLVVATPAYPLTSRGASHVQALDVIQQPTDASFVLTSLLRQASLPGDRAGLDALRRAAAVDGLSRLDDRL